MNIFIKEKRFEEVFDFLAIYKGITGFLEIIGGSILLFLSKNYIFNLILKITQEELLEDPKDFIANYLLHLGYSFSLTAKAILAAYLIASGIVKCILTYGLIKKKLHFYPISAAIFSIFVVYQIYRYTLSHSIWLIILSIIDIIYIVLIIHEYNYLKNNIKS